MAVRLETFTGGIVHRAAPLVAGRLGLRSYIDTAYESIPCYNTTIMRT